MSIHRHQADVQGFEGRARTGYGRYVQNAVVCEVDRTASSGGGDHLRATRNPPVAGIGCTILKVIGTGEGEGTDTVLVAGCGHPGESGRVIGIKSKGSSITGFYGQLTAGSVDSEDTASILSIQGCLHMVLQGRVRIVVLDGESTQSDIDGTLSLAPGEPESVGSPEGSCGNRAGRFIGGFVHRGGDAMGTRVCVNGCCPGNGRTSAGKTCADGFGGNIVSVELGCSPARDAPHCAKFKVSLHRGKNPQLPGRDRGDRRDGLRLGDIPHGNCNSIVFGVSTPDLNIFSIEPGAV